MEATEEARTVGAQTRSSALWEKVYPYLFILPALLAIGLFTVYPMLYAIRSSVYRYKLTRPNDHPYVGLQNFVEVVESYYFRNSLQVTALYTVAAVTGVILFGLAVALLLNQKFKSVGILKIAILLPWAIPAVVSGLLWKWILNADFGVLNGILFRIGLIDSYIPFLADPLLARLSLVSAHVWKEGPLAAIFFLAGLQLIPPELYESARIDGGSTWQLFWRVTLPLLRPTFLVVLVYETMIAILTFDIIVVLTGGGPADSTALISWFAYAEIFRGLDLGHGIALSIIIAALILSLILVYLRILAREEA